MKVKVFIKAIAFLFCFVFTLLNCVSIWINNTFADMFSPNGNGKDSFIPSIMMFVCLYILYFL